MKTVTDLEIITFWDWFLLEHQKLGYGLEDNELLSTLDKKIAELGSFSWEVGPGLIDERKNSLIISPCGDKEGLTITQKIVSLAPNCSGWEFYPAKVPKKWGRIFETFDTTGKKITINASEWEYVLFKFPDGTFDIVIKTPNLFVYDEQTRFFAVEIVLDAEIGEERRVEFIEGIDIVSDFDAELAQKNNPIEVLSSHFNKLVG